MSGPQRLKPVAPRPNFAGIPDELKRTPNWVVWKYLPPSRAEQKWRKVPFQPNGSPASTVDNATWNAFEGVAQAYEREGFDGVGFVFDGEVGPDGLCFAGVDF